MKKVYTKPQARLEVFELNEFIAGDCAAAGGIIINVTSTFNCSKTNQSVDWYSGLYGIFSNACNHIPAADGTEGFCYFSPSGTAMATFSS